MTSTERILEYAEVEQEQPLYRAPPLPAADQRNDGDTFPAALTYADYVASNARATSSVGSDQDFGIELSAISTGAGAKPGAKPRAAAVAAAVAAGRGPPRGVVEFRQVWMQYRDNPPVLKGISFTSKPGERIGVSV